MPRRRPSHVVTVRVVVIIFLLLLGGAVGGWRPVTTARAASGPSTLSVHGTTYTVTHAEQVKGLSDEELGGMSHGVQSLVTNDKALITVSLVVGSGNAARSFDASVLEIYPTGSSVGYQAAGGTLNPGRLRAHARIEGSLSFIVPRNGAQLALRAPGSTRDVPLLQVDVAAGGAGVHEHGAAAPTTGGPAPLH